MEDLLFAVVIGGYVALAFAWPTLRVWRRHGVWPIVFDRESAPAQRLLGFLTGTLFAGLVALAAVQAVVGRAALGVWPLPAPVRLAGWLALLCGAALTVLAQRQMGASWRIGIDDRPTDLVTGGIFRFIRNPIFTGLLLSLAGVAVLCAQWWSVAVLVVTALSLRVQVAFEEGHLIALHGDAYLDYAARAGRFVPLVGRLRARPAIGPEGIGAAARGVSHETQ
ncbi:MAG: isoprenylcysteine carboxylmethyltransferase family protein [Deltaproteobacteria bacterium]|nr:isoprenylcysteine carboxylmethyltransferase family protein [Deltaproteobacteria bacterium]